MTVDLSKRTSIHVVGVGGAGMSAIASVLATMGHRVTGSDLKRSPVLDRLVVDDVEVSIGHSADHLGEARLVTHSPAVRADNPELRAAEAAGIPIVSRAEMLGAIASLRRCLAVAGTHGKTTTSSMAALILVEAGLHPSLLIGADINDLGTNGVWDDGAWLVLEADESYGAFANLAPDALVVTNVEADHLDHYGSFEGLRNAFGDVLARSGDIKIVSGDDPVASSLGREFGAQTVGVDPASDWRIEQVELAKSASSFDLVAEGGPLGRLALPVPGLHNVRNAAAATVAAMACGAAFEDACRAMARFAGVPRRFEFRGEAGGVTFVDDYAHLPGEIRATLDAARRGGWDRIVAIFQPHRFTRTASLAATFADAFAEADVVYVTDIYSAGERPLPGISGRLVADAITGSGSAKEVHYVPDLEDLRRMLPLVLRPGDLCCTLGAGDLTTLPDALLEALG